MDEDLIATSVKGEFRPVKTDNLFSIDTDAHLDKLTRHTYRSGSHYPVELVRLALKRNASRVSIHLNETGVEIRDNGTGIEETLIDELKILLQTIDIDEIREQAILNLQNDQGIGLLAIFSPSPSRITIENNTGTWTHRLDVKKNRLHHFSRTETDRGTPPFQSGTRITLDRKSRSVETEIKILREYCRGVSRAILLNDELISQQSLIRHSMVWMKLDLPGSGQTGEIAIPKQGDVCRIWLLNQGIPITRKVIAPWRGYIFDAAVETSGELTARLLDQLSPEIRRLYRHLTDKYNELPQPFQNRLEELLFRHHRLSGDSTLVEKPPLFSAVNPSRALTITQLRAMASGDRLFAVPEDAPAGQYRNRHFPVLQLSRQQADYLVNHAGIPIHFLPLPRPQSRIGKWFSAIRRKLKSEFRNIILSKRRIIPPEQLSDPEKHFIVALSRHQNQSAAESNTFPVKKIGFIKGRGCSPGSLLTARNSPEAGRLVVRRNHPRVKTAVESVFRNPENIEYIAPLFQ
jgi:hypothetical protein